jgi:hypothetical protein
LELNEHFPISKPKTSRIEDNKVSAAESLSGLPENPLVAPTSIW